MSKQISLNTKITFLATGDKYSISEQTITGFQFKPIRFERGLPSVPRTFEEVKQEFLNNQIDIEGFEHAEADNRLVELIMDGYIKDSLITGFQSSIGDIQNAKVVLEEKVAELVEVNDEQKAKIIVHETTISEQKSAIAQMTEQIKSQTSTITGKEEELGILKNEYKTQKDEWGKEKKAYEKTIAGLEAVVE